ncbi:MAG TPA: hypothetical protein VIK14_09040 [Ignavibacteria bacterium]
MENRNVIDFEFKKIIEKNPDKKFILYLRTHPNDEKEQKLKSELVGIFGECKELPDEKLVIFIIRGIKVNEFIDKLNSFDTRMYLSFIQSDDEINKSAGSVF